MKVRDSAATYMSKADIDGGSLMNSGSAGGSLRTICSAWAFTASWAPVVLGIAEGLKLGTGAAAESPK